MNKLIIIGTGLLLIAGGVTAQNDTTRKRSVDITSTFKPVLREAAKINFNASPPVVDTSKPRLQYVLPNQNLLFAYQPGTLKPLALEVDSGGRWNNTSYLKAGFGSLKTPYIQAGISFGDGKSNGLNIYARHISSDGKREFQQFSNTDFSLNGFFQTSNNLEWNARLGMRNDKYYKYGFVPDSLKFPEDSILQRFQTWSGRVALRNINRTEYGISYAPEIRIDVLGDNKNTNESNTYLDLPLEKKINEKFAARVGITFDLTRLKPDGKDVINNTMYYISPSVLFKSGTVNLEAGIRPTWDNKEFKLFPNILAEISSSDNRFTFQLGWTGYVRKTTYQYLSTVNPYIWVPDQLQNTRIEERYAGFKGSVGDHFTYSAKIGSHKYKNTPLFVNDSVDGKSFHVLNEADMNVLHFGGEVGYTVQEKFSLVSGITFNQYSNLQTFEKAYGLIPIEFKTALRLQVLRDLFIKGDIFAWSGPQYLTKEQTSAKLDGAFDLNGGIEFKFRKNLSFWAQFNNILNKEYSRWNQYPGYGFSFIGGVVFSFDQKNLGRN